MTDETPNDQQPPDPADTFAYDVYLSYSDTDRGWVHTTLLPRLEAEGVRICIGERDFRLGAPRLAEQERAILSSRKTLVILTPRFLASGWAAFDHVLQQTLDAESREYRLIPLRKEACDLPPSLRYLTAANFVDPSDPTAEWTRLITTLRTALPVTPPPAIPVLSIPDPAPLPPGSRMPLGHNPLFVGREEELRELARVLKAGDTAAIGQIAAATGLGGIGKTQLASEFVHRYGKYFPGGVFWLSFADPAAVPVEVAACGGLEGMQLSPDFSTLPLDEQVQRVLAEWRRSLPRLLVFDNCEDEGILDKWRPKHGGCRILVTSRRAKWDTALGVHALPLGVLPRSQSIALLRTFRPDLAEDDVDLHAIAEELGDLPLALHLAGSFLQDYQQDMTAAKYLDELRSATGMAHESLEGAGISPTKHDLSVARTFHLSYDRLDANMATDALALAILARTTYFASGESIPRGLLGMTLEMPLDEHQTKRQMTQGVRRLVSLGLIEEEAEGAVRMHRLVAAFVRAVGSDMTVQLAVEQMMFYIANELNAQGYPGRLLALQPHFRAITNLALEQQDAQAVNLGSEFAYHLHMVGAYGEARRYYAQTLTIQERVLGKDHPDIALSLNNLGSVLGSQGQYVEAQRYFEQALVIQKRVLGMHHPHTAVSLNNLGAAFEAQGRYAEAQHYYELALAIREQVLGKDHPDTARSLNSLGVALEAQGRYVEAQHYYELALAIQEQVLGKDHPTTAGSLSNLGSVFRAQGQYREAQSYHELALVIRKQMLGPDHPDTAVSFNNLGAAFEAQGRYVEAQHYYELALAIREQVLGKNHPDTALSLNNLGSVFQAQGRYVEAQHYYELALAIQEQVLGPDHLLKPTYHWIWRTFGDLAYAAVRSTEVMCTFPDLVSWLLPNSPDLHVTAVERDPDHQITVIVTSVQAEVHCPNCRTSAARIHSRYTRTISDLPWADFTVRLQLTTRKWFCLTPACPRRIFTERLPTIVAPWARRTRRLAGHHQDMGLTLGGRAGARLARGLAQPTSRDTLLRGVRRLPDPVVVTPCHLGVDDFALRKGQRYGTLLVDLDHGDPIDVLPDRSAATLAHWLRDHPGVELISRDRAVAYAEGATAGAPGAVQVADRWHILKNLGEALSRLFAAHPQPQTAVCAPSDVSVGRVEGAGRIVEDDQPAASPTSTPSPSAPRVVQPPPTQAARLRQQRQARRELRYAQVHALVQQGVSLRAIARQLNLSRGTVRTYARAATAPIPQARGKRASLLAPYVPYLLERWNAGCHVGAELLREIEAHGYQGGRSIVMDFFAAIRKQQGVAPMQRTGLPPQTAVNPTTKPPTPRELAWLVLQRPERLDEGEQAHLLQVRHTEPKLELAVMLAQEFAVMLRERQPDALDGWLERIETSGLGELRSFAGGIRRDYAAVKAALTLQYSNGVVEGNINRLKYLKKQMYGRANFDLLRKRVLYAPG